MGLRASSFAATGTGLAGWKRLLGSLDSAVPYSRPCLAEFGVLILARLQPVTCPAVLLAAVRQVTDLFGNKDEALGSLAEHVTTYDDE